MLWLGLFLGLWLVHVASVHAQSVPSTSAGTASPPSSSTGSGSSGSSTTTSSPPSASSASLAVTSPTGILYSNNPNIRITNTINLNTKTYSYDGPSLITIAKKAGGAAPTGIAGVGKVAAWGAAGVAGMLVLGA